MSYKTNTNNRYAAGTVITAKENPGLKLLIMEYVNSTYYCTVIGDARRTPLIYMERDLIPPSVLDQ